MAKTAPEAHWRARRFHERGPKRYNVIRVFEVMSGERIDSRHQFVGTAHRSVAEWLVYPVARSAKRRREPPHQFPSLAAKLAGQEGESSSVGPQWRQFRSQAVQRVVPRDLGPVSVTACALTNQWRPEASWVIHRLRQRLAARATPALRDRMRGISLNLDEAAVYLPGQKAATSRTLETRCRVKLLDARNKLLLGDQARDDLLGTRRRARVEQYPGRTRNNRTLEKFSSFHLWQVTQSTEACWDS